MQFTGQFVVYHCENRSIFLYVFYSGNNLAPSHSTANKCPIVKQSMSESLLTVAQTNCDSLFTVNVTILRPLVCSLKLWSVGLTSLANLHGLHLRSIISLCVRCVWCVVATEDDERDTDLSKPHLINFFYNPLNLLKCGQLLIFYCYTFLSSSINNCYAHKHKRLPLPSIHDRVSIYV